MACKNRFYRNKEKCWHLLLRIKSSDMVFASDVDDVITCCCFGCCFCCCLSRVARSALSIIVTPPSSLVLQIYLRLFNGYFQHDQQSILVCCLFIFSQILIPFQNFTNNSFNGTVSYVSVYIISMPSHMAVSLQLNHCGLIFNLINSILHTRTLPMNRI